MHSLDRVNRAWDRQHQCNIGPGVIGACPRFVHEQVTMPTLLDFSAPTMRATTRETAIAEKFHAMVVLGIANTRMKDFSDFHQLAQQCSFTSSALATAIAATCTQRKSQIPAVIPLALTEAFAKDPSKQAQWKAFCRKNKISTEITLSVVVADLATFLLPPLHRGEIQPFPAEWPPGGPWTRIPGQAPMEPMGA